MKYEEAIAKLEQIARQLEQNQLPIDQIAAQLREAQELEVLPRTTHLGGRGNKEDSGRGNGRVTKFYRFS